MRHNIKSYSSPQRCSIVLINKQVYKDIIIIELYKQNGCQKEEGYLHIPHYVPIGIIKLRGPGFKSRPGTVGGPVTIIMWGARPGWKLALS